MSKFKPWALYYQNEAYSVSGKQIMGRQAAGNSYLKAVAKSNYEEVGAYARNKEYFDYFIDDFKSFLPNDKKKSVVYVPWGDPTQLSHFGGLYYPAPDIAKFTNQRYFYKDNNYSVVGITHTTASEGAINSLIECYTAPLMPWDAIICTSVSVKNSINTLYDQYHDILKFRLGATKKPNFELPVIPLGVHLDDFNFSDIQKNISRDKLGIKTDDIAVLFLGRLSFHAKAHHAPMYIAVENVKKNLPRGVNLHLIQTGWFPNDAVEQMYRDDANKLCPSVQCHFLDGRNLSDKELSYSASDIFISLVDNFQETFGLTPLEGMASGLPAIVSDWDGYKGTVRNGIDGFRITTSTMEEGNGFSLALRHNLGLDSYDHYIGRASQTVSVNIDECIEKLTLLALNKDLRKEMGINAKKRASEFGWEKVIAMYDELKVELDSKRDVSKKNNQKFMSPVAIQDPYSFFNDYPTFKLNLSCELTISKNNNLDLEKFYNFSSITYLEDIAPDISTLKLIYDYINNKKNCLVLNIINDLTYDEHTVFRSTLWLSKYGYVTIKN